ncbi:hypothetical protein [Aquimarina latercula]|uniref:hypothetical protein n=1 Tax=Aquimarina latercula TaxID=987 RepID=UPI0003F580BE|nr:hypothetical protein [Aquimarina latercula]
MTTHYQAHIVVIGTVVKLTYQNGNFKRFEVVKKGKLAPVHLLNIGRIIPLTEKELTRFVLEKKGKVNYTVIEKNVSMYGQYTAVWFDFYRGFMDVEPNFTKVDGANLKRIMTYLEKISVNPEQALELWKAILHNWDHMDDFHKQNTDIKYIYSQINKIVQNVKRNNETYGGYHDDELQSVVNGL